MYSQFSFSQSFNYEKELSSSWNEDEKLKNTQGERTKWKMRTINEGAPTTYIFRFQREEAKVQFWSKTVVGFKLQFHMCSRTLDFFNENVSEVWSESEDYTLSCQNDKI